MRKLSLWLVPNLAFALILPSTIRAQEYRGTFEQQLACTPDVLRLCGSEIPDVNRIVVCLRQNTAQLGDACKAVFEAQNSAPPKDPARTTRASH